MSAPDIEGHELVQLLKRTTECQTWLARNARGEDVVVKGYSDDGPDAMVLFASRATSASTLNHPSVARLRARGKSGDLLYVVRDHYVLGSLAELSSSLDVAAKLRVCLDIGRALAHAHQRGLVHGALKPSNILFSAPGVPALADFMVAGTSEATEFSAPEQRGSAPSSPRVDQFALAAVAAWSLLGRMPRRGEQLVDDPDLDDALKRSLSAAPGNRLAHFDELTRAFDGALAPFSRSLPPPPAVEVVRLAKTLHVCVTGNWTPQAVRSCVEAIDSALDSSGSVAIGYLLNAEGGCHSTAIDALAELHRRHQTHLKRVGFVSESPQARGASVLIGRRVEGLPWKTFSTAESMDAWLNEATA